MSVVKQQIWLTSLPAAKILTEEDLDNPKNWQKYNRPLTPSELFHASNQAQSLGTPIFSFTTSAERSRTKSKQKRHAKHVGSSIAAGVGLSVSGGEGVYDVPLPGAGEASGADARGNAAAIREAA